MGTITRSFANLITASGPSGLPAGLAVNTPAFFARRSSDQNIAHASAVKIQLTDELIDTNSAFDNVTNYRFTVPSGEGGKYSISHQVGATGYTAARTISMIFKNGSVIVESESFNSSAGYNHAGGSLIISLNAGDYLELYGYQNSGVTAAIRGGAGAHMTYLSGYKIIE
jgi:hypothetical protein